MAEEQQIDLDEEAAEAEIADGYQPGGLPERAPFPWFGGKRRVADVVWRALGSDVPNYIEPFFGSGAVLLGRPGGPGKIETANDIDRFVCNLWRAIVADPWAVAEWCDAPVNEAEMHAVHVALVSDETFRERMHTDASYFDVEKAGKWIWGQCMWIGGGWCAEPKNRKRPKLDGIGKGVHSERGAAGHRKIPNLAVKADGACAGRGVHSEAAVKSQGRGGARRGEPDQWQARPHMSGDNAGMGVHRPPEQLPSLRVDSGAAGNGVNASGLLNKAFSPGRRPQLSNSHGVYHLPALGNDRGVHGVSNQPGTFLHALRELSVPDAPPCFEWFRGLMLRLRRVRFACGDWRRVLGPSVLGKGKNVGGRRPCAVFLDPPYAGELRARGLYAEDDANLSVEVREWALENGDDPDLRIALCGYVEEHGPHMPESWQVHRWKGARGYAGDDNTSRESEAIWFSPACHPIERQLSMFGG